VLPGVLARNRFRLVYNYISLGSVSLVLLFSVLSVLFEAPLQHVEAMTTLQQLTLLTVAYLFVLDLALLLVHGLRFVRADMLYIHHPIATLGVAYQLGMNIGGGAMVLLLLDSIDALLGNVRDVFPQCRQSLEFAENVASFLMRVIWYPYASLRILLRIGSRRPQLDPIWCVMILVWCLLANYFHFRIFLAYLQTFFGTAGSSSSVSKKKAD